jgi:UDP:flavonoid glycosyltransferase YjiC (YdhE family)
MMANLLFVTWDGGGNVPPAVGIAAELEARGHTVAFLGHARQAPVIPFPFTPTSGHFDSTANNGMREFVGVFGDRGFGADALATDADLLVIDCVLFGAMDAARRAGRPYVILEHLYDGYIRGPWLKGPMGLAMRVKRLHPTAAFAAAESCLVASLAELDAKATSGVLHTGPVVSGTPAAPERPAVLVSLSSCNYPGQQAVLQNVLDAVAELDAHVTVTTGPIDYPGLRMPTRVDVRGFVPHPNLMPHASLVVGHGGHATTMAALAHDLPLLILPMHPFLDQPIVGQSVQDAGAGLRLPKKAKPGAIRVAIEQLLADGPHRAAAARLGSAIRAARGAHTGADAIEAALQGSAGPLRRPAAAEA